MRAPVVEGPAPASQLAGDRRRRIRVLFCVDQLNVGGTELNAVRTAEALDRSRFELSLACFKAEGPLRARYDALGVPIHHFRVASLAAPHALREGLRFAATVRRGRYDLVHAHDMYSNIFAVPWARIGGRSRVIASRRWWTEVPRPALRHANRMIYRMAHTVLVNSHALGNLLETSEGVPRERIAVVPNFVTDEAFAPPPLSFVERTRAELGLPPDAVVVGIIANFHDVKRHDVLLDAIAAIAPGWPSLRVVLVGDGVRRDALQRQAAALGIADRVIFAGLRPHQPSFHHLFDISVLTSREEGFPNTVVEAMAAGRPVIATSVGGTVDAVVDGETGLLTPPGDIGRLTSVIEQLLADPSRRQALGAAGRERARTHFHVSRAMAALEALYERLAGVRATPSG